MDHTPVSAFDLMDMAYRIAGHEDPLRRKSHPPPLTRAKQILDVPASRLRQNGRDLHAHWRERSDALRRCLKLSGFGLLP